LFGGQGDEKTRRVVESPPKFTSSQRSIRREKSGIHAVWGNFDPDRTQTAGTPPFIRGAVTVEVNPGVNPTAAKMDAEKGPTGEVTGPLAGTRLTGQVK